MIGPRRRAARTAIALGSFCALLGGCQPGEKIATVSLSGPGTAETRFTTTRWDLGVWADWEGQWQGGPKSKLALAYDLEAFQDGKSVGTVSCSTRAPLKTVCQVDRSFSGLSEGQCEVKLACRLPDVRPGVEVVLRVTGRLADPARTKRVGKMSLNIRAN